MADIKVDNNDREQHRVTIVETPILEEKQQVDETANGGEEKESSQNSSSKRERVASLDIFRGLTVALMVLVDDAGGEWPVIGHAPWNGCNLADFVMPFFLFIVGVAIALALKRITSRVKAIRKVILRTFKLLFWGLLLQGGYSHAPDKLTYGVDMKMIRWCGILQRIALVYLLVALLEISTRSRQEKGLSRGWFSIFRMYYQNWVVGGCILIIYVSVLYGTFVPDWHFRVQNEHSRDLGKIKTVSCNVRGKLNPPCNAVGYIDRLILGVNHMYPRPAWKRSKDCTYSSPHEGPFRDDAPAWCVAPFEPEGILSSISAILSAIIGVHFGHVLIHMKDHSSRLQQWVIMGFALLVLGTLLHVTNGIVTFPFVEKETECSFKMLTNRYWFDTNNSSYPYSCSFCQYSKETTEIGRSYIYILFSQFTVFIAAIPLNKQLYTFSYVCVTAGAAALVFSAFYIMVDIWKWKFLFLPLQWIGMNAMLVYVMAAGGIFAGFINGWYYENPDNTLVNWIQKHIFIQVWHSRRVGILLYVVFAEICFWGIVAGILHWFGIYWKL